MQMCVNLQTLNLLKSILGLFYNEWSFIIFFLGCKGLHLYTALILALMATLVVFILQMFSTYGLMGFQINFGF